MPRTAAFITLGCKINQYETEAIREEVLDLGYDEVEATDSADVYVVNTCSVTAMAGTKSRKAILRAARNNPEARIIVVGCSSQSEKDKIREIPQVAFLAGNEEKAMVASFLSGGWKPGDPFPDRDSDILSLNISRYRGKTRATIKVQDGCNNFCSFCIIPHLRGTSKSRHPDAVVEEIRRLVENGFVEIVLSGIHLQDYAQDLDAPEGNSGAECDDLVGLLEQVAEIDGLRRVRMSSLGTKAFSSRMLDVLEHPVFCKHWHIPIQAGSDEVLDQMRRGYTLGQFQDTIASLRDRFPDAGITTDVIVGHPGETDEVFERSFEVYRDLAFSKMHVFPFSFREGTLSAKLWREAPIDPQQIRQRARAMAELDTEMAVAYRRHWLDSEVEVLVEGAARGREGWLDGLTDRYVRVAFEAPSEFALDRFPGTFQPVHVSGLTDNGVSGSWAALPDAGLPI